MLIAQAYADLDQLAEPVSLLACSDGTRAQRGTLSLGLVERDGAPELVGCTAVPSASSRSASADDLACDLALLAAILETSD